MNEENHKICIIKIIPYEANLMEYLQYFIENKEKEYSNKSNVKKTFIFIIYMNRVLNKDLANIKNLTLKDLNLIKKNLLEKTLTHLSEYYQIFIDNLNGNKNIIFNEIIKKINSIELLNACINTNEQLYLNIFKSISYMK